MELDDTDRTILRLLVEDARRPYADIAERVDLSPPAVSDRVSRLREMGVIRRLTADIDRSVLRDGIGVLLTCRPAPGRTRSVLEALDGDGAVEHLFETAEGTIVASVRVPDGDVGRWLGERVSLDDLQRYDVSLLAHSSWSPDVGEATFAPDCVECGNTVTSQGTSRRLDGTLYHFCCPNCEERFVSRYEELAEGA